MEKILNIYGQPFHHAEAKIIGTTRGLTALRDALNRAITNGIGSNTVDDYNQDDSNTVLWASDGEGYDVIIEVHNDIWGIAGGPMSFWNKEESYPEYTSLV